MEPQPFEGHIGLAYTMRPDALVPFLLKDDPVDVVIGGGTQEGHTIRNAFKGLESLNMH